HTAGGWFYVHAPDFYVKQICRREDDDVCPVDGEFLMDAVADGRSEGQHCCDRRRSEEDRQACERLATSLPTKTLHQKAKKHCVYLTLEDRNQRLEVRCLNNDLSAADRALQRNGIAPALLAHRRGI